MIGDVFMFWRGIIPTLVISLLLSGCAAVRPASAPADDGYTRLPIIMYHHITKKPSLVNNYTVLLDTFENDLKYIKEKGYNTITVSQLIAHEETGTALPENPIMITFDDGFESVYAYAYPLLQKYEMTAVLSVVGEYIDRYTENPDHRLQYSCCDWNEIRELDESGVIEIQNHTYNLHSMDKGRRGCSKKQGESPEEYVKLLKGDLSLMQQKLIEKIGRPADAIAYPFGSRCDLTDQTVKEMGFKAALTCDEKTNLIGSSEDYLFKLGRFNRKGSYSTKEYFEKLGVN